MKSKFLMKIIVLLMGLTLALGTFSWANDDIEYVSEEQLVDVGVKYGKSLKMPIKLSSETPMVLAKIENERFVVVHTLNNAKSITIRHLQDQVFEILVNGQMMTTYDSGQGTYTIMTQGMMDYMNHFTLENFQAHLDRTQMLSYVIKYNQQNYRGGLILKSLKDGTYGVINSVYFEDYILGVLPKEMSKDWPIEALKAQAVAARNFGMISKGKHDDLGFDLCATSNCQVYSGFDVEGPISNQAVFETYGENLYYDNRLVSTFYHSSSGGFTSSSEYVWQNPLPYLKPTPDPYSEDSPNANWQVVYSKKEIEGILATAGYQIGELKDIRLEKDDYSGRVIDMIFEGSVETVHLEKQKARVIFGYNTLKSMLFSIAGDVTYQTIDQTQSVSMLPDTQYVLSESGNISALDVNDLMIYNGSAYTNPKETKDSYIINGSGWGHGLGLSQYGAKKMAELGFNYKEILSFYYNDTVVK